MSEPRIGITMSISVGQTPERVWVNTTYVRAVQDAGGVPVLLPPTLDGRARRDLWPLLSGVLLTGGADLDPARFGEERHPATYEVSVERDELEVATVSQALAEEVPILAICRGLQVLNVALGGSLWQDLPSQRPSSIVHSQAEPRPEATHAVTVRENTGLAAILGQTELRVNSFHHQAIKQLGKGLREAAWAPDGVVEAVELPDAPVPVVAVQWHPEDLVGHDEAARRLFLALVHAAHRRSRDRRSLSS